MKRKNLTPPASIATPHTAVETGSSIHCHRRQTSLHDAGRAAGVLRRVRCRLVAAGAARDAREAVGTLERSSSGTQPRLAAPGSKEIKTMPFGAGRRSCPGAGLGILHVKMFLARRADSWLRVGCCPVEVHLTEENGFFNVMKAPHHARRRDWWDAATLAVLYKTW